MENPKRTILIAGGGPAGLLAGLSAARAGARVIIFEKNGVLGKKLAISGGGRANLTNVGDHRHLVDAFGPGGRFLYSAFSRFDNVSLIRLMEEIGIAVKEEDHGRIFPLSNSAVDVVLALENALLAAGAEIRRNSPVLGLLFTPAAEGGMPAVTGLAVQSGVVAGDALIVTTGGVSFPKTGATGDAYPWLAELGHSAAPLKPGLAPLLTPLDEIKGLQGLSLRDIRLTLFIEGKKIAEESWDLMFAHFGLTGPAPLSLSHRLPPKSDWRPVTLQLDLLPSITAPALRERLKQLFRQYPARQYGNLLAEFRLPPRLLDYLCKRMNLPIAKKGAELSAADIEKTALALKQLPFTVTAPGPMDGAMVTAGGVKLDEVDPKTMASRKANNLYIAGEILDLAARSGGFNLQAAWSTGWVAGESAAHLVIPGENSFSR